MLVTDFPSAKIEIFLHNLRIFPPPMDPASLLMDTGDGRDREAENGAKCLFLKGKYPMSKKAGNGLRFPGWRSTIA
ncbi:MAG: hypothetical protein D6681_10305 [Calditrichaeota bacterium]|nr:MAG: hypothetical protein D6681_10305 [Calditrichota bacterium]